MEQLPRERGVSVDNAAQSARGLGIGLQLQLRLKAQSPTSMKRVYLSAVTCNVLLHLTHVAFGRCAGVVFVTSANQPVHAHALTSACSSERNAGALITSASDLGDDSKAVTFLPVVMAELALPLLHGRAQKVENKLRVGQRLGVCGGTGTQLPWCMHTRRCVIHR